MSALAACYMDTAFDPIKRKEIVENAVNKLSIIREQTHFDAIAFRGVSGAIIAPIVADRLGVGLIAVRKPNDNCHSSNHVEGTCEGSYVIVDDFVCTGETVKKIVEAVSTKFGWGTSKCVGYFSWVMDRQNWPEAQYVAEEEYTGFRCLNRPLKEVEDDPL